MKKLILLILTIFTLNTQAFSYTMPDIKWDKYFHKKQKAVIPETKNQKSVHDDAVAFYNTNDITNAYELLKSIPNNQKTEVDYLLMANIMQDKDKLSDAAMLLQKALEINPKFYKAYYNLGYIAQSDGKNDSAIKYYKKALRYNRNFAYAYYNIGICYARKQEFRTAKSYFNRAILRKKDEPDFYYNLAYVYKKLNDNKNAAKSLTIYNNLINR